MVLPFSCASDVDRGIPGDPHGVGPLRRRSLQTRNDLQVNTFLDADHDERRDAHHDVVLALGQRGHEHRQIGALGQFDSQTVAFEDALRQGRVRRKRAAAGKHRYPQWGQLLVGLRCRVRAATRDHKRQARKHIRQETNQIPASHQLWHLPPWSMSSNVMPVAAVPTRKSMPSTRDRNNRAAPRSRDSARAPRHPSNPPRRSHRRAGRCWPWRVRRPRWCDTDEVALRAEVGQVRGA